MGHWARSRLEPAPDRQSDPKQLVKFKAPDKNRIKQRKLWRRINLAKPTREQTLNSVAQGWVNSVAMAVATCNSLWHRFFALTACASCPWTSPCWPGPAAQSPARPPPSASSFLLFVLLTQHERKEERRRSKGMRSRAQLIAGCDSGTRSSGPKGTSINKKKQLLLSLLLFSSLVLFCLLFRSVSCFSPSLPKIPQRK